VNWLAARLQGLEWPWKSGRGLLTLGVTCGWVTRGSGCVGVGFWLSLFVNEGEIREGM